MGDSRPSLCTPGTFTSRCEKRERVFFNNYKYTVPKYSDVLLKYPNSSFMLSTCGQLKSTEKWLGGSSSVVSISTTVKQLGYLRTLQVNKDNSLSLILTGGSTCSSNERITTEIRFKCSEKTDVQPTLLYERPCHFLFEWRHTRSCPVPGAKGTMGPYYVDYQNCKYNFGWRTRYACFSGENGKNGTTMVSNGSSQIERSAAVGKNNRMLSVGSVESETEFSFVSFTSPENKISPSTLTADTKNLECKYNGGNKLRSLSELGRRGVSTDVTAKLHFSMVYHFTHVNHICSDSVSCLVFNNSFSINLGSTFLKPMYKSDDSMTITSISGSICDRLLINKKRNLLINKKT
ncbi:hypothetical protein RUM44_010237 [Polyplax serrata]|uniref:MRH domain-containing protein n=1 Tax=Polyplax serrata TaxID=468196 RepID=A0ABR1AWG8_POLSC